MSSFKTEKGKPKRGQIYFFGRLENKSVPIIQNVITITSSTFALAHWDAAIAAPLMCNVGHIANQEDIKGDTDTGGQ